MAVPAPLRVIACHEESVPFRLNRPGWDRTCPKSLDSFNCRRTLKVGNGGIRLLQPEVEAEKNGLAGISQLPYSMKVLLENLLRNEDGRSVTKKTSRPSPAG
jgi:hypothetical protein